MATLNIKIWKWIGFVVCALLVASPGKAFSCEGECKCTPSSHTALQRDQVIGKCVCREHSFLPREYADAYALEVEYIDHAVLGDYCGQTFPHLLYLNISGFQYILPGSFTGHRKVTHLRLLHEFMHVIEPNVFTGLDLLEKLWADTCGIYVLKDGAFFGLPKLNTLSLSNNSIWSIHENSFSNLSSLVNLDLSKNEIIELSKGHFRHLSKLQKLNLSTNIIKHIERGAFQGLTSLRVLDLEDNLLKVVPQPKFFMGEVSQGAPSFVTSQVYLHGNSLQCYCQMSWIYNCIKIDGFIIEGTCSTPTEVAGQTLRQVYGTSMDQCKPNGTVINVPSGAKAELPCTIAYAAWLLPDGTKITERGQYWDELFLTDNNYLVIWNTKRQHTGTYVCQSPDGENELFYNVVVPEKSGLSVGMWAIIGSVAAIVVVVTVIFLTVAYLRRRRRSYEGLPDNVPRPQPIPPDNDHCDPEGNDTYQNNFVQAINNGSNSPGGSRPEHGTFKYNDLLKHVH
ncbi:uncharacterized protein [Diadema antillarum]|uniref:uncharacterized protein n=1 Tax=Diadema antillarum TaxID=105358 RepID=UPI003A87F148